MTHSAMTSPLFLALMQATPPADATYLYVAVGLLILALVLFVLEFFVPSGGLLALLTAVCALGSIGAMLSYQATWGMIYGAVLLVSAPFAVVQAIKVWSGSPLGRRAILSAEADRVPTRDEDGEAVRAATARPSIPLGATGEAVTVLRPVGFVNFEGRRVDAVAESGFVAEGTKVVVIGHLEGQPRVRAMS